MVPFAWVTTPEPRTICTRVFRLILRRESYPFIESSHILRIFGNRRFKRNVLNEPRHKPRNPLGSVSDIIERNGLSKLLEVGQQATFPLEYRKPVKTSAKFLQPAANADELGSVFTNQNRRARPEFLESYFSGQITRS